MCTGQEVEAFLSGCAQNVHVSCPRPVWLCGLTGQNSAVFQIAMYLCERHMDTARLSVSLLKLLMQFYFDAKVPEAVLATSCSVSEIDHDIH